MTPAPDRPTSPTPTDEPIPGVMIARATPKKPRIVPRKPSMCYAPFAFSTSTYFVDMPNGMNLRPPASKNLPKNSTYCRRLEWT